MTQQNNPIPLNVSSPLRACKNVNAEPLWIERSDGEYLIERNGKKYIDFMYGFGPIILGHNHPKIAQALKNQVDKGTLFGTANHTEQALASLIVSSTQSIEKIRFLNSGTEAVMSAVRLARAYTARTKVITFKGGYHGHSDLFIHGDPIKAGINPAVQNGRTECIYNNLDQLTSLLHSREFSCVVIEPIACNMSLVMPDMSFLSQLRQLCTATGTVLIFDEVISGFRYCFGSVANILGIQADVYTFGKIIGGGTPIGAVAGAADILNLLEKQQVLQGGTFSGNPLSMAGGLATLEVLNNSDVYQVLDQKSEFLEKEFRGSSLTDKIQLVRYYSTFAFQFGDAPATNYEEATRIGKNAYGYIYRACRDSNIHLPPDYLEPLHLSLATSENSISQLILTVERAYNDFN
jgi:glutamate-1-semialdehyde 2,1-aminomutase